MNIPKPPVVDDQTKKRHTIRDLILQLRHRSLVRYAIIGGVSYVAEVFALLFLAHILHLSPVRSVAFSFWIGLAISFSLQKYIAFKNKDNDKKTLGRQAVLYGALVLFNYTFTLFFVNHSANLIGLVPARTIALITTVCWNYFAYKKIFRQINML